MWRGVIPTTTRSNAVQHTGPPTGQAQATPPPMLQRQSMCAQWKEKSYLFGFIITGDHKQPLSIVVTAQAPCCASRPVPAPQHCHVPTCHYTNPTR
jgi:hypothetical protein